MVKHLTARVAWHDDGWNGRICKKPDCNIYCVGAQSFPGDVILRERNLASELVNADKPVSQLSGSDLPPCVYSVNAFGTENIKGYSDPPVFFFDGAKRVEWDIPPSTVCAWPYEAMYGDHAKKDGYTDNDGREKKAKEFFEEIEESKSLIFYYANYSNPFSEEDNKRYVLVGVSRIKKVGEHLIYKDVDKKRSDKYARGMVWARNVSSHYPDEGFRIPYHLYRDEPDKLEKFAVFPENPITCKYGGKLVSSDDAIGLLEQLLSSIRELIDIDDIDEDWLTREKWTLDQIALLWKKRGLYPGLLNVMRFLSAYDAIEPARALIDKGESQKAYDLFFSAITKDKDVSEFGLIGDIREKVSRQWRLKGDEMQRLLREIIPRFDLDGEQIKRILDEDPIKRSAHGLPEEASVIIENPYTLCENYVGDNPDDRISWGVIDRGVFPSPELGGEPLADMIFDDARRLRSLCVEELHRESNQTFQAADLVLKNVNSRILRLPDWKSANFTLKYFEVDHVVLEGALVMREEENRLWLYLRDVYNDERIVEDALTKFAGRSDISLDRPFSFDDWKAEIRDIDSPLLERAREKYELAINAQAEACERIFIKPLSIITGAAGTGKTSAICAIIRAIRKTEGEGVSITVLAPTGKASDRTRAKMEERSIEGVKTATVHSFLARGGWLNNNLTLKREGGKREGSGTIIVDESSMLDLELMASLVRAIQWNDIKRFILVGDPNQLPPIGRGRVFADIIKWLRKKQNNEIADLKQNLRQLENEVEGRGGGILNLAELFIGLNDTEEREGTSLEAEEFLSKIHNGGDVTKDLRIIYWSEPTDIAKILIKAIENEMEENTRTSLNQEKPWELWRRAFDWKPQAYQVLTPHRGDLHGVEAVNQSIQERIASKTKKYYGTLDGITLCDKVIQYRNRSESNPIIAYNFKTRESEKIKVFNGEIGFVQKHNYDNGKKILYLKRFQVKFERKENFSVGYGNKLPSGSKKTISERVKENLELAYAISVHKAQGSEFDNTYILMPQGRSLTSELLYTAITRATKHCTLLVQNDISTILSARRLENSQTALTNSSLFSGMFRPVPDGLIKRDWYKEGKIHKALSEDMVRSKSEVIIANILHGRDIEFHYELLLKASDGTICLPDFTIIWQGETWYWEHWGMLDNEYYNEKYQNKLAWYEKHFSGRLLETFDNGDLSEQAINITNKHFPI